MLLVLYRPGHCVGRLVAPLWRVDLNANFRRPQWNSKETTVTFIERQSLPLEITPIAPELTVITTVTFVIGY